MVGGIQRPHHRFHRGLWSTYYVWSIIPSQGGAALNKADLPLLPLGLGQ